MKNSLVILSTVIASAVSAQSTWKADVSHSSVKFSVAHLVVSETEGTFKVYDANVAAAKDDFTDAKIDFTIDVNSINTDNEMRDKHLKSDDFFNAEKFPKIVFKGISFKKVSGNKYVLEGDLTIRDVTKKVKLDVVYGGTVKDPYGNTKAGFKVTGVVDRLAYGLKWNALTEAGGAVVGKDVELTAKLELQKQ
jgi:polyisoprenoid-binding protein YceI